MPSSASPKTNTILAQVKSDYPAIEFVESSRFSWHANGKLISYKAFGPSNEQAAWALLHELGHALLEHTDFETDIELLKIEVAAWERARTLAAQYALTIDDDYIQNCLDSYRDWLHLRSTCPTCYERSLQADKHTYHCVNCRTEWHVTRSRLCRPYRKKRG